MGCLVLTICLGAGCCRLTASDWNKNGLATYDGVLHALSLISAQDGVSAWASGTCTLGKRELTFDGWRQGWTALGKPMGTACWSWHGQSLRQGSHCILVFELALCITFLGVGPGKIHHCWTLSRGTRGANPGKFTRPVQSWVALLMSDLTNLHEDSVRPFSQQLHMRTNPSDLCIRLLRPSQQPTTAMSQSQGWCSLRVARHASGPCQMW